MGVHGKEVIQIMDLIEKSKKGNKEAFAALMDRHKDMLYNTALLMLKNEDDVLDAVQDTLLTCWEKLPTLKQNRYFKTWLTKILLNKCYDCLRLRSRFINLGDNFDPGKEFDWDTPIDVGYIMKRLPQAEQVILSLFYYDDLSTKEIAKALSISEGSVRTRLNRSRNHFKRIMTEEKAYEK